MNGSLSILPPYALRARAVMALAVVSGHCLGGNGMNREKNSHSFREFQRMRGLGLEKNLFQCP
jgi:hypothetical protein